MDPSSYSVVSNQTQPLQLLLMCTDKIFLFPCLLFDLSTYSQEYFLISDPSHLYTHADNIIERKVIFVLKALFLFELKQD